MPTVKEILSTEDGLRQQTQLPAALKGCSISRKAVTVTCGHKHVISEQYVDMDVREVATELENKWDVCFRSSCVINGDIHEMDPDSEETLCMEAGDHLVLVEE